MGCTGLILINKAPRFCPKMAADPPAESSGDDLCGSSAGVFTQWCLPDVTNLAMTNSSPWKIPNKWRFIAGKIIYK
jgi:hypothetical protein